MTETPVKRSRQRMDFFLAVGFLATLLLGLHFSSYEKSVSYAVIFVLSSAVYLLVARQIFKITLSKQTVLMVAALFFLVRLSYIDSNPIGSDDAYRYVWDGKVQSYGINPYRYAPAADELADLRSSVLSASINFPHMKTVYFPLGEWLFYLAYQLSGEGFWGLKLLLLCAEVLTCITLFFFLRRLQFAPQFILLYALCPLPILQFAVDAHVDGFGLPLLVFALLLYFGQRKVASAIVLGLAVAIKPVALVILPVLFFLEKGPLRKTSIILLPLFVLVAQFLPYVFNANPFESLVTYTREWMFNGMIFNLLNWVIQDNYVTRVICAGLLFAVLVVLNASKGDVLTKIYYSIFFLLLCSPVVHMWYVAWLAVLLPLARRWSGILFVSGVSLASYTAMQYAEHAVWKDYPVILLLEYIPVVVLLALELRPAMTPARTS
jgi:alpha-1,6-mannosyltransferase